MKIDCYIEYSQYRDVLEFYFIETNPDGQRFLLTMENGNQWKKQYLPEAVVIEAPSIELHHHMAKPFMQAMADALYKHGINPTQKPILENELTAIKYHLEDMRKLVFKK